MGRWRDLPADVGFAITAAMALGLIAGVGIAAAMLPIKAAYWMLFQ